MNDELRVERKRWGYDPNYLRCVATDPEGGVVGVWFEESPLATASVSGAPAASIRHRISTWVGWCLSRSPRGCP